ncbi:DEKNAAC102682 [Brettanomyces naardenensis]|uniref:DEKNAAC102683 n=1 Tax=Brettanomyces naardenensis TaxID=13370 RepID=A0A448YL62_BRENA|nr:DEKNAAC102682 [Brettanomyces naardenensis]
MQRFVSGLKKQPGLPISSLPRGYEDDLKPKKTSQLGRFTARQLTLIAVAAVTVIYILYIVLIPSSLGSIGTGQVSIPTDLESSTGGNELIEEGEQQLQVDLEANDPLPDTVEFYDLGEYQGTAAGKANRERVLLLVPLRNCEKTLPLMFRNMMNMTYDHDLIDIAFLVSDCSKGDKTLETLNQYTAALQKQELLPLLEKREKKSVGHGVFGSSDLYEKYMPEDYLARVKKAFSPPYHSQYTKPFHSIEIYQKDFGQVIGQSFSDRHDVKIQGIRRKLMGRARNWLLTAALKPYHSWVYWRDVDIETSPGDILEFMMKFAKNFDVIVPNVWRPLPTFLGNEQPYDLNSWIESDQALQLAKSLDEDDVIVEGYAEYPTWRAHLAYIRDAGGNPNEIVELDGVGGVSILAKAQTFRSGDNFPAFTFMNHAETEAFGKMAKRMGYRVGGLPHYTIWHIYEPSQDDLQEISKLERKRRRFGTSKDV